MAIYFIEMEGLNLVKIGFTERDPHDRVRELQTANPHKLKLLFTMEGTLNYESYLHNMFSHLRTQGEWFRYTSEIQSYIMMSRYFVPHVIELQDRVDDLEKAKNLLTMRLTRLEESVDRLIDKVEDGGHPDAPPVWQGQIEDLRNLIHHRITR